MPAFDQTDLQQTFIRLIELFNAGNYNGMRPFLHPNIIWKMLHHADSITGAENVIQWLLSQKVSLNPQFVPDSANEHTDPPNSDGSRRIHGPAQWKGQKDGGSNERVEYNFTFTTDRNSRWLLINAFGHLTH
jgi:hypothetical protein